MATIYVIRHGQASFGSDNYDQLSPLGLRQAQVTGQYLESQGIRFDAVYSGDLQRQRQTAECALAAQPADVPHHIDARFNEIDNDEQIRHLLPKLVQDDESLRALVENGFSSSKDYQKVIDAVFNHWVSDDCHEPEIQSWASYSGGVRDALRELIENEGGGKTIGLFTSGGTIATITSQVLGLDGTHAYRFYEPVFNCSITQLFYSRSRVSLSFFNDVSFLRVLGRDLGEELVSYR